MSIVFRTFFLFVVICGTAAGQGLRVSTVVYDASRLDTSGQEVILSSSFSLFHNGRVYDYVEAADEVVVFEHATRRFTVLNDRRGVFTNIAFAEIQNMLKTREPRTQEYIKELTARKSPQAEKVARMLAFQLKPSFKTTFATRSGLLALRSPSLKYSVSTRKWDDPDQIERYLKYTDWTARLNYILHPTSMFPEPRIALNEELRKLDGRIPVIVQRDLRPDERAVLRAEHQFVRNLTDHDRSLITQWDRAVSTGLLQEVPLRKYQEAVLVSGK